MVYHVLHQVLEEHDRLVYLFHRLHDTRCIVNTSSSRIQVSRFLKDGLPCAFQLWQQKLLDVWNERGRQRASLGLYQPEARLTLSRSTLSSISETRCSYLSMTTPHSNLIMSRSQSTGAATMPVRCSLVRLDSFSLHCWRATFREAEHCGCDVLAG
jgi:hypothetical protein